MNLVVETSTQGHPENPQPDPAPPAFPDPTHPDPQEPELPPVDPQDPGSSVPKASSPDSHPGNGWHGRVYRTWQALPVAARRRTEPAFCRGRTEQASRYPREACLADHEKMHRDLSSSVPPVLDTRRDRTPVPLGWQSLSEEESRTPAHPSEDAEGAAGAAGARAGRQAKAR